MLACECDARGRLGHEDSTYPQRPRLLQALAAARSVNTQAVVDSLAELAEGSPNAGPQIAQAIHAARVEAVKLMMPESPA
jgi:tRNA nucleotidyltransferase (CCA-adding enzyme)